MKTLKEKWLDALPIIWGFISVILLIYLLIWGIFKLSSGNKDQRSIEEISTDRYKSCIRYADLKTFPSCEQYLKVTPTPHRE